MNCTHLKHVITSLPNRDRYGNRNHLQIGRHHDGRTADRRGGVPCDHLQPTEDEHVQWRQERQQGDGLAEDRPHARHRW